MDRFKKRLLGKVNTMELKERCLLLLPMPWQNYTENVSDDEVTAIYTYIQSTHPVKNIVPQPWNDGL